MSSKFRCQKGASLIELMITVIIGAIAMMALAVPFIAERSFESSGRRQAEAQRDAQMAMRSMSRAARDSSGYTITAGANSTKIDFVRPCGAMSFEGGPTFNGGQIRWVDACVSPSNTIILIDGVRSRVTALTATAVSPKLIRLNLGVTYQNQQSELLETDVFLRNAV